MDWDKYNYSLLTSWHAAKYILSALVRKGKEGKEFRQKYIFGISV
jgi:hypothetical protein